MTKESSQNSFSFYFEVYGGWKEIFKSKYSRFAFLVTIFCSPYWLISPWWETVLSVIPNLLGFTLGGYAMLMAFGDSDFHKALANKSDNQRYSPLIKVNATFVHFIVLQVISLIVALVVQSFYFEPTGHLKSLVSYLSPCFMWAAYCVYSIGFFIFTYALTSTLAATFGILRLMKIYDVILRSRPDKTEECCKCNGSSNDKK